MAVKMDSNPIKASPNWEILLYIPNIVGHVRLVLLLTFLVTDSWGSFYNSDEYSIICLLMLTASILLDVVDGWAARTFNQCSKFGYHYDIALDCLYPILVYGQCRHPLLKVFAGFFAIVCTIWCLLAMSTSWKVDRPKHWPSSQMTNPVTGKFTLFGHATWYLGFAGGFLILYALDRRLLAVDRVISMLGILFMVIDLCSFIQYDILYVGLLLTPRPAS